MSGKSSRRRGHQFERDVAEWLRSKGVRAHTARELSGGMQLGSDLITDLPTTIECKNAAKWDVAGWLRQARNDAKGDPASLWIKKRGSGDPGASYVVMQADDFLALVRPDTEF